MLTASPSTNLIASFHARRRPAVHAHEQLLQRQNEPLAGVPGGGVVERWRHPVLTAAHVPVFWRYDFDPATNPLFLERLPVNAVFNPGAIRLDGRNLMVARVEGADRKSFFA